MSLGAFRLGAELGRGATGVVYEAVHVPTGIRVAIKTVQTTTRAGAISLDRELAAMSRLNHVHILQVIDHGVAGPDDPVGEGVAWLALEFASEGSLGSWEPADWDAIQVRVLHLLDGLAHAHARGLVHRDLKPDNLMICSGADVRPGLKISDFGLAWATDRDRRGIRKGGTPLYIAPEQVRGAVTEFGPWTDLYALGAILWHWTTGTPPFGWGSPDTQMRAHTSAPLPDYVPQMPVPDGLEAQLRALLAKAPEERPASAADLVVRLLGLGAAATASGSTRSGPDLSDIATVLGVASSAGPGRIITGHSTRFGDIPAGWHDNEPAPPARLVGAGLGLLGRRDLRLLGREEVREELWAHLRQVGRERRPRVLAVVGDPGLGASRLARWLEERSRELGCAEGFFAEPEAGLAGLVSRAFGLLAAKQSDVALPPDATEAEQTVFAARDDPSPRDVLAWLLERSERGPVVLRVDDPDASPPLAKLLEEVLFAGAEGALCVVATGRPDGGVWGELDYLDGFHRCVLGPLPHTAMMELATRDLGLENRLAVRMVDVCSGVPGTLVHWVRNLAERGELTPGSEGFQVGSDLPLSLPQDEEEIARFEVAWRSLRRDHREAVRVGSVLGQMVDVEEWRGTLHMLGLRALEQPLRQLGRAGWVNRSPTAWRFRSPALRMLVRSELSDSERVEIHLAAAGAFAHLPSTPQRDAHRGLHLLEAGHRSLALRVLAPVLHVLTDELQDYPLVFRVTERLGRDVDLQSLPPDQHFDILFHALQARRELESSRDVEAQLDALFDLAPQLEPGRQARAWRVLSEAFTMLGDHERALHALDALGHDKPEDVRLRATIAHEQGKTEEARALFDTAWASTDIVGLRGAIANGRGRLEAIHGNLEGAVEWFERASVGVEEKQRALPLGNLAMLHLMRADLAAATAAADQALECSGPLGIRGRAWLSMTLAIVAAATNDGDRLRRLHDRAMYFLDRYGQGNPAAAQQMITVARRTAEGASVAFLDAVEAKVDATAWR